MVLVIYLTILSGMGVSDKHIKTVTGMALTVPVPNILVNTSNVLFY